MSGLIKKYLHIMHISYNQKHDLALLTTRSKFVLN